MAGFLMDGYRPSVAWFWEFVVLFRKLTILGVSLFIWEPFLQSFAAVIVLIAALAAQLYFQPFELLALNLLELSGEFLLFASICLFVSLFFCAHQIRFTSRRTSSQPSRVCSPRSSWAF